MIPGNPKFLIYMVVICAAVGSGVVTGAVSSYLSIWGSWGRLGPYWPLGLILVICPYEGGGAIWSIVATGAVSPYEGGGAIGSSVVTGDDGSYLSIWGRWGRWVHIGHWGWWWWGWYVCEVYSRLSSHVWKLGLCRLCANSCSKNTNTFKTDVNAK